MSFTPAQMEQDGSTERARLENLKQSQMSMRAQLANISDDIIALNKTLGNVNTALDNLALPPAQTAQGAPPVVPPFNPPPIAPPPMTAQRSCLKPATPTEYDGSRGKGRTFYNSCMLYTRLCPMEFPDDQAKINWVLSYMKGG